MLELGHIILATIINYAARHFCTTILHCLCRYLVMNTQNVDIMMGCEEEAEVHLLLYFSISELLIFLFNNAIWLILLELLTLIKQRCDIHFAQREALKSFDLCQLPLRLATQFSEHH